MLDLADYGCGPRDINDLERDCKAALALGAQAAALLDALDAMRTSRADGLLSANRHGIANCFHDELRSTCLILADVCKEAGELGSIEADLRAMGRRLDVDWQAQQRGRERTFVPAMAAE